MAGGAGGCSLPVISLMLRHLRRCRRLQEFAQEFAGSGQGTQGTCSKLRASINLMTGRHPAWHSLPTIEYLPRNHGVVDIFILGSISTWMWWWDWWVQKPVDSHLHKCSLSHYRSKGSNKNIHEGNNAERPKTTTPCNSAVLIVGSHSLKTSNRRSSFGF